MGLLHLKDTDPLLHSSMAPHHHRAHLRQMVIRHKVIQAIHLLRGALHRTQDMEDISRHLHSNHQDRTVVDIRRHHQ